MVELYRGGNSFASLSRTKQVILGIYDAMAKAMRTVKPYLTLLASLPADPRVAHLPRQATAV